MKEEFIQLGELELPTMEYASQGNAILGIRDSGKSYTGTFLAEQLCEANVPFIAFDPIGLWKFLKVPGAGKGYPVVVAAAEDGDITLEEGSAAEIVRAAMTNNVSVVIDLYSVKITKAEWRRIVHDAIKVLLYENKSHGLRHIFLEEAAEFAPQRVGPDQGRVYSVIESLARMGGNAQLGYTLINQRAEEVNKAVLELCDCLFLHRQKGRNSLTALSKWLDFGNKTTTKTIIDGITKAGPGECWIWPRAEEQPKHVHIPRKNSYHPDRRARATAAATKPGVNVEKFVDALRKTLADKMKATEENERKAEKLTDQIDKLELDVAYWKSEAEKKAAPTPSIERIPVFGNGDLAKLMVFSQEFKEQIENAQNILAGIDNALKRAEELNSVSDDRKAWHTTREVASKLESQPFRMHEVRSKSLSENSPSKRTGKGPMKILCVAAGHHPVKLTTAQLGTLAAFTPSTVQTYLPAVRASGWMQETADGWIVTPEGFKACGVSPSARPMSKDALRSLWLEKLNGGESRIFGVLIEHRGRAHGMTLPELMHATGYTESTIKTYLPTLRRNKLIDQAELKVNPEFI